MLKGGSKHKLRTEKLENLLEQSVEAGSYTAESEDRSKLQTLALEIADAIFQTSKKQSNAVIKAIPGPKSITSVVHNLPFPPNPFFINRRFELERLKELSREQSDIPLQRTVAICGLGGVGKTQLAVEFAWRMLADYDAVFFLKATSPQALDIDLAQLTSLLYLREGNDRNREVQIKATLGWFETRRRWLIIADNADTEEAVSAIRHRLQPKLAGFVLITSRFSEWPVSTSALALSVFTSTDGTRFLLNRANRNEYNPGGEEAALSLAEELGNLPLALEHAAAAIVEMRLTFEEYRARLHTARPELLEDRRQGASQYPESIVQTFSTTLERCTPLSQLLLRITCWLAAEPIPRGLLLADSNALQRVVDEKLDVSDLAIDKALGDLARLSLITLTNETFSVHRLLQAVEQDALNPAERQSYIIVALELLDRFAPDQAEVTSNLHVWRQLASHVDALLRHTEDEGVDTTLIDTLRRKFGLFLKASAAYAHAREIFERAITAAERRSPRDDAEVARNLNNLAEVMTEMNQLQDAEPLYDKALEIRVKVLGRQHVDVAEIIGNLALVYSKQGRYADADLYYNQALDILRKAEDTSPSKLARSLNNSASFYLKQGQYERAESLLREALKIHEAHADPDQAQSLSDLASVYYSQSEYARAEEPCKKALAIWEKTLGPDHPELATGLNNLGALYYKQGRYAEAEPIYERALAIWKTGLGPEHPAVASGLNNLATLYHKQSRWSEAEPLYEKAIELWEKALSPNHPDIAPSLNNLARFYADKGEYKKATLLYERALNIRRATLDPGHPAIAISLYGLAVVLAKQGDFAKAQPLYEAALAIRERTMGPDHVDFAACLHGLGEVHANLDDQTRAESFYERALAIRESKLGLEHPDVATTCSGLAALRVRQSKYAAAASLYKRALVIREKVFGQEHPEVANILSSLARVFGTQGEYAKAESLYRKALGLQLDLTNKTNPKLRELVTCYTELLREQGLGEGDIKAKLVEIDESLVNLLIFEDAHETTRESDFSGPPE
jgi:tetratricopeptide (TPR) repeat protein